ncbi:MAG: MarR family winged helix-turn-helix transcriptional regulator [Micromonosporaceae bacterium]
MTRTGRTQVELNAEIVKLLFSTLDLLRGHFGAAAAEAGLSGGPARALINISEPTPMRHLASDLACDPSNVTGIVDDLEQRGLVTREPDPGDRRIKLLVLTARGRQVREEFMDRINRTVPGVSDLTDEQRRTLRDLLREVVARR